LKATSIDNTGERKSDEIFVSLTPSGTFNDPRDGQIYATLEIGNQTWFAENLNYETSNSWWYNNSSANGDIYCRLYTWESAINACPNGWHLPSDDEWKTMEMTLGMIQSEADDGGWRGTDEGEKMKSTSDWFNCGNGTNISGFNALPGGVRNSYGMYSGLGANTYFWSYTEYSGMFAWYRFLQYGYDQEYRGIDDKSHGRSVRCIKD